MRLRVYNARYSMQIQYINNLLLENGKDEFHHCRNSTWSLAICLENSLYFIAIALHYTHCFASPSHFLFLLLLLPFDIAKIAKLQCFHSHKLTYISISLHWGICVSILLFYISLKSILQRKEACKMCTSTAITIMRIGTHLFIHSIPFNIQHSIDFQCIKHSTNLNRSIDRSINRITTIWYG